MRSLTETGHSFRKQAQLFSQAWRELVPEQKEEYQRQAEVDRARFVIQKGLWSVGLDPSAFQNEDVRGHAKWKDVYDIESCHSAEATGASK